MTEKRIIGVVIFFISIVPYCFTQKTKPVVEFYSTETTSRDKEMLKLTEDLLFSYINDMDKFRTVDKRPAFYTKDTKSDNLQNYIFSSTIEENGTSWDFTLRLFSAQSKVSQTLNKTYENYYRILLETRSLLNTLFDTLLVKEQLAASENMPASALNAEGPVKKQTYEAVSIAAPEILSGNWKGEDFVEKIVILRGGRGFIIYTNGASMNISIKIQDGMLIAAQTGKSNPLFYPNLPREVALVAAETAPPITYRMKLSSDIGVLFGEKTTIEPVYQGDAVVSAKPATVPVLWTRQ